MTWKLRAIMSRGCDDHPKTGRFAICRSAFVAMLEIGYRTIWMWLRGGPLPTCPKV
jgi:hypothetical protein